MDKTGNKKGQLYAELFPQAATEEQKQELYAYLDSITDREADRILKHYDYSVPFGFWKGAQD